MVFRTRLFDQRPCLQGLTKNPAHHIYRGHLHECGGDILTYLVFWIDNYVDSNNRNIDSVVDLKTTVDGNLREKTSRVLRNGASVTRFYEQTKFRIYKYDDLDVE